MEEINLLLDGGLSARDKSNLDYFTDSAKTKIRDAMDKLLDDFSKLGTTFTHSVTWGVTDEGLKKSVIIIYFRASPEATLTKSITGAPAPPGNAAGWTVIGTKATISEAYVEMNFPTEKMARIAVHEMLHNKCQMDNDALHDAKKGGGGIANSPTLGSESVTPENAKLLSANLTKNITQWRPGGSLS